MNEATVSALDRKFGVTESDAEPVIVDGEVVDTETGAVIATVPSQALAVVSEEDTEAEHAAKEDFDYSRKMLKTIAVDAQMALSRATEVATQTDNAKSFEAVARLISASVEIHRELQDTHEKRARTRVVNRPPAPTAAPVNIQNGVVFNGTADELLALIKPERT